MKTITIGTQKGGSGKTTTAGVTAYLLSQIYRVLAVDMDSQGNLTELITQQDIYSFKGTVLDALKTQNPEPYIVNVSKNLDLLTATDHLAIFPRWLYEEYHGNRSLVLAKTLAKVKDNYDYIIIDTPPALGDQTINAMSASDGIVAMFETSQFCYSALSRFIETIGHVQNMVNNELKLYGVLCTMIDSRRADNKALLEIVKDEYKEECFETVVQRRAATGRLGITGFYGNKEIHDATDQYKEFVRELLCRI